MNNVVDFNKRIIQKEVDKLIEKGIGLHRVNAIIQPLIEDGCKEQEIIEILKSVNNQ